MLRLKLCGSASCVEVLSLEVKATRKLKAAVSTIAKSKSIMESEKQWGLTCTEMKAAVRF